MRRARRTPGPRVVSATRRAPGQIREGGGNPLRIPTPWLRLRHYAFFAKFQPMTISAPTGLLFSARSRISSLDTSAP